MHDQDISPAEELSIQTTESAPPPLRIYHSHTLPPGRTIWVPHNSTDRLQPTIAVPIASLAPAEPAFPLDKEHELRFSSLAPPNLAQQKQAICHAKPMGIAFAQKQQDSS
ncbi:hypothetical protein MFU01_10720 [Myxococcus fulvus]|uniref:Uncharacterized protein n=1 Tax=Myxococcus fulvus TaxID=33 RepID=A0A511SVV7_MYXFU|nr:hypothetical protein MFU01_10720 [Myxococcus fulvus]